MQQSEPRIDVVLPTQNGLRWVGEAVDSVLAQTYPHYRLTIVDDASTDETPGFLRQAYGNQKERVVLIELEQSKRAAGARMVGIERAEGELIAFIDQDDRWNHQKLERQVAHLRENPQLDAVHADVRHIDEHGNELPGAADQENEVRAQVSFDDLAPEALVQRLFVRNSIRLASSVVKREAFENAGGFDDSLFGGEDWEWWVRFASMGHRIGHVAMPLLERRIHAGNTSRTMESERRQGHFQAIEKVLARHPVLEPLGATRKAEFLRLEVREQIRIGDVERARQQLHELRRLVGWDLETWIYWLMSRSGPARRSLLWLRSALRGTGNTPVR